MFSKKILSLFVFFFLFFGLSSNVFTDDTWFKIDNTVWNSVNLSWNKKLKASFKWIYYWEKEFANPEDAEWQTELIEWNNYAYRIDGLNNNTRYYFMLVWQNENWEDIFASDVVNTDIWEYKEEEKKEQEEENNFKLREIKQLSENKIELLFSNPLNLDQNLENKNFKIENSSDKSDYLVVNDVVVKRDKLLLEINWKIPWWVEYKVIVFNVIDKDWNNIKNWVDAEAGFIWEDFTEPKANLNSASESKDKQEDKKENKQKNEIRGKDLQKKDVKEDVIWVAEDKIEKSKETETKTWPKTLIIVLLSILIWVMIIFPKYKKN